MLARAADAAKSTPKVAAAPRPKGLPVVHEGCSTAFIAAGFLARFDAIEEPGSKGAFDSVPT